jgi:hypothetical protein
MKNKQLTLLILLISNITFGQINAVVVDSISLGEIPYVNIWVEKENIGTTTNENGLFTLNNIGKPMIIVFSAIGYETRKVNYELINSIIKLKPKITELREIIVYPEKKNTKLIIGDFKKSKINFYFSCGISPWIITKHFEYNESYSKTPFLEKIRLLTNSAVDNARFNIRLYSVGENGKPQDYIYPKNIIGVAQKGKKITEIDIAELNIKFPEEGFFIAFEWLIIESNKYEYNYTLKGSKKKLNRLSYEPKIGTTPDETDKNSWIFNQGRWEKLSKNKEGTIEKYKDKYSIPAIELLLTN